MSGTRTPATTALPRRGMGLLVTGAVLLILGIAAVTLGLVQTAGAAVSMLNTIGSPQTSPATITSELKGGSTYALYQVATTTGEKVQVGDITVTGPSGDVPVTATTDQVQTAGSGNQTYAEVATFEPPTSGSYTVKVVTADARVAVAPALSTAAKGFAWIVAIGLGSVLAGIGVILLIVGLVLRLSSPRKPTTPPPGYPVP